MNVLYTPQEFCVSNNFTPLGHRLCLIIRGVECERSCAYEAVSDLLDQRQTEVTELVKAALESLGNRKNQQAINAFNHATAQDVAGATVAFEVYHRYFCLTTSNCSLIQRFRYRHCPRRTVVTYVFPSYHQ
jgi:hypothetical protein